MIYTSDKELHRSKLLAVMERCCLIPVRRFPSPYRSKLTEIRPNIFACTFIEVSALYRFCYKPNLTVLKSCMMLSDLR